MVARRSVLVLVALSLLWRTVVCQYDDPTDGDEDSYRGDEGGYGEDGGYGGEEEEAPPPPPGEVVEITTVADLDAFIDNEDASVVGAFTAKEMKDPTAQLPEGWDTEEDGEWEAPVIENPALTSFNQIAGSSYGYRFAYTTADEVLEKLSKKKAGGLYLFRSPKFLSTEQGDRPRERFPSDKLSESAVSNWLTAKAQPLVGLYSSSTSSRYTGPTAIIFMNLDFDTNAKGVNYVLKRARKAAKALKGKISVAVARLSDMNYELADYGLESNKPKSDVLVGIKVPGKGGSEAKFYGSDKAFSGDALTSFAEA